MISLSVLLAAVLVVWNVTSAPISVLLDDVLQCTVSPQRACEIAGITPGQHHVDTGATLSYRVSEGKTAPGQITLPDNRSAWKICRFAGGVTPDACNRWTRDDSRLEPPNAPVEFVAVKH
jgi:hypothetical protein